MMKQFWLVLTLLAIVLTFIFFIAHKYLFILTHVLIIVTVVWAIIVMCLNHKTVNPPQMAQMLNLIFLIINIFWNLSFPSIYFNTYYSIFINEYCLLWSLYYNTLQSLSAITNNTLLVFF